MKKKKKVAHYSFLEQKIPRGVINNTIKRKIFTAHARQIRLSTVAPASLEHARGIIWTSGNLLLGFATDSKKKG